MNSFNFTFIVYDIEINHVRCGLSRNKNTVDEIEVVRNIMRIDVFLTTNVSYEYRNFN